MKAAYIIGGCRTPIGKTNGILKKLLPEQLSAHVLNAAMAKHALSPASIDHVILGNAVGPGGNIARLSLLEAGWHHQVPATTIDCQCGSGLSSIHLAAALVQSGQCELVIAGGTESTSMEPRRQYNPRDPRYEGSDVFLNRAQFSPKHLGDPDMIEAAENLAELLNISRSDMDKQALSSHNRAIEALELNRLKDIIAPIELISGSLEADECIRKSMSYKLLERMPALVREGGRLTAGNTCLKHDGAAVIIIASENAVSKYDLKPLAQFIANSSVGVDPNHSPLGPIPAIKKLLESEHLTIENIDAFEINEAFALKTLACARELNISLEKINVFGGALAYGHPYGASGAIILLHLLEVLKHTNGTLGIAALGIAGGQGIASMIKIIRGLI